MLMATLIMNLSHSPNLHSQSQVQKYMNHFIRLVKHLDQMIGDSEFIFFETVYKQFTSCVVACQEPQEVLDDAILKISKIQLRLERCSAVMLQEVGVGVEVGTIDVELRRVCSIQQQLEAMLCEAMLDPKTLITAHTKEELPYQRTSM
jgi:hypothetical protein